MKKIIFAVLILLFTTAVSYAESNGWDNIKRGWSRMPIKVYLDETTVTKTDMIKSGFSDWENKSGRKVRFTFLTKPHSGYANITVGLVDIFSDQTAGITKAQMGVNKIYKSHIDIGLKNFYTNKIFNNEELAIIIRHEIGHSLGLDHSDDTKSIMYPNVISGQTITKKDIENLLKLY